MIVLIKLVLAHILVDFFLQPKKWVASKQKDKIKSIPLVLHALLHGLLTYILIADWTNFVLPLVLIIVHWSIDVFKVYRKPILRWFLFDQVLHLISLVFLWGLFYGEMAEIWVFTTSFISNERNLWFLVGYLLILNPASILIDLATKKWQKELKSKEKNIGLQNAGKWIGMLERVLILTFIIGNQYAAIGFLITAKSIFRFGDLTKNKERKLTEYILIGTFLSFMLTLIVGLFILNQTS